ncbi:MAG: TIGR02147 family protein [Bdellovibrionia bacterium]
MIFKYDDYQEFLSDELQVRAKANRGEYARYASAIGSSASFVSLVINQKRHLNEAQAFKTPDYLGLDSVEREYFYAIYYSNRAGSEQVRNYWKTKIESVRKQSLRLDRRLEKEKVLAEDEQAMFYSSWLYSAARLLTSIPGYQRVDSIRRALDVTPEQIDAIIEFLVGTGLVVRTEKGLEMGQSRTHLSAQSPFIGGHHRNWRTLLLNKVDRLSSDDLVFTGPCTLSADDFMAVRETLAKTIQNVSNKVAKSPAEEFACLNIDWFRVVKK